MSGCVDLHLHSTASDGQYTPTELVHLALGEGLKVIALTDHDSTDGVQEALDAAKGTGLTVIPGVEISTDVPGEHEVHILGYCINCRYSPLQEELSKLRQSRFGRARLIVEKLAQVGCPIRWERVLALAGDGAVGRPHIAQAMVEAGYVDSVESAFRLYLGRGAVAYVPRPKLAPRDAVRLILDAGGVPVLAHPVHVLEHLPGLVRAGLRGLEVYYDGYEEAERRFLLGLARKHGLIATGGSDFHGLEVVPSAEIGAAGVPWSAVEELLRCSQVGMCSGLRGRGLVLPGQRSSGGGTVVTTGKGRAG